MGKLNIQKIIILFLTVFVMNSCQKSNEPEVNPNDLLLGNWVEQEHTSIGIMFKRMNSLNETRYGVSFKLNGDFIERSSGWCGTPPLNFSDYTGSWIKENTLIKVSNSNYPGNFNWRIVSLDETTLIVKRELTEQEIDHQNLMNLFHEIRVLSESVSCTNSTDWTFTAYGAKACGGPQGHIAYSKTIDKAGFLQKVATYTEAEKQYNIKWGIISTCNVTAEPKTVECQNGFPLLKY